MHLVLDVRQKLENLRVYLDLHGFWRESEEQLICAVTVVFGKSCNRNTEMKLVLYNLADHLHLAFAAVGDDEVWQLFAFFFESRIASAHHLTHRGIVVGTLHRLDVEMAITGFVRLAVDELHHASYGVVALEVGVVETLNDCWRFRQM